MKIKQFLKITLIIQLLTLSGCMKEYLDFKRNKSQVTPVTIDDFRSLLENSMMNTGYPSMSELGSDDYYILENQWNSLSDPMQKNGYIWADEIFEDSRSIDWNNGFEKILHANLIIEGIGDVQATPSLAQQKDEVLGGAIFFRGINYFYLSQVFCKQFDKRTAKDDLGLPLRQKSNINVNSPRSSLLETYEFIISDLHLSLPLLPLTSFVNTRPSKIAAMGALSMVYLQMEDYDNASKYADSALTYYDHLIDYNYLDLNSSNFFPLSGQGNSEIILYLTSSNLAIFSNSRLHVSTSLYNAYSPDDIRKSLYFSTSSQRINLRPLYNGRVSSGFFSGISSAELILIRAEADLRIGERMRAISGLNSFMRKRYLRDNFVEIKSDISDSDLLFLILSERRRELLFRGRRWMDLRRFNSNQEHLQSLSRVIGNTEYILKHDSPKWVWPIPNDAIMIGGYLQNPR